MPNTFEHAWRPLPKSKWNADNARHLLYRASWAAKPEEVQRALEEGMEATLERLFPEHTQSFTMPRMLKDYAKALPDMQKAVKASKDIEARRIAQKRIREELLLQ